MLNETFSVIFKHGVQLHPNMNGKDDWRPNVRANSVAPCVQVIHFKGMYYGVANAIKMTLNNNGSGVNDQVVNSRSRSNSFLRS